MSEFGRGLEAAADWHEQQLAPMIESANGETTSTEALNRIAADNEFHVRCAIAIRSITDPLPWPMPDKRAVNDFQLMLARIARRLRSYDDPVLVRLRTQTDDLLMRKGTLSWLRSDDLQPEPMPDERKVKATALRELAEYLVDTGRETASLNLIEDRAAKLEREEG